MTENADNEIKNLKISNKKLLKREMDLNNKIE